jgi:hypothetical protein
MNLINESIDIRLIPQLDPVQTFDGWVAISRLLRAIAAISLIWCVPHAQAGTISTDFDPSQTVPGTVYGSAATSSTGGAPNGTGPCLQFDTQNGESGLFVLKEVDPGLEVEGFAASFDLLMGGSGNSALHGNGFSFSFVPTAEVPQTTLPQAFLGTGSGLKIAFVTYNHQEVTNTDLTIQVRLNNQLLGVYPAPYLNTGTNFVHVTITARANGNVDLVYGTQTVFSDLFCFTPTQGQFCLAADSQVTVFVGDTIDLMWLQHLSISTTVTNNVSLVSASPLGSCVAPNTPMRIQLRNNSSALDPSTLALKLNGVVVSTSGLSVAQSGNLNTISYQPPAILAPNTGYTVELIYQDKAQPPNLYTNNYSFVTYPYLTLPASYAVGANGIKTTDGNAYYIYLYQSTSAINETLAIAEQSVSGAIPNSADLTSSPNSDGGFNWPANHSINFSTGGAPGEFLGADNGSGGTLFPNSTLGSYYAVEVLTYLQLNPGTYSFGVDAVSNFVQGTGIPVEAGFKLTAGPSPRNFLAPPIASFDNAYPEGNLEFSFVVTNSGIYPFRLLAFSGPGAGTLEWYMVTNGTRVDLVTGLGSSNVFGTAVITHPWVESSPTPLPGDKFVPASSPIKVSIVDGTATTVTNSIAINLNGSNVAPQSITRLTVTNVNTTTSGQTTRTVTQVSYTPPGGLGDGTSNFVTLAFSDTSGLRLTNTWSFSTVAALKDPHLLVIEAEDYFTNFPADPAVDNPISDQYFTAPDPNTGLSVHEWVFGSLTVTDYWSYAYADYPNVVANPAQYAINIPGYSGRGYMVPLPNVNYNVNTNIYNGPGGTNVPADCGMAYNVYFQDPGIYYIWCRGWGDSSPGPAQNKSCNFGIDWVEQSSSFRMGGGPGFPQGAWNWDNINAQSSQPCYLTVATSGWHVINLWMREDGFVCDKFLLTTNKAYVPSGLGPAANLGTPSGQIILSITTVPAGVKVSWTGGAGILQQSADINGAFVNVPGATNSPVIVSPLASRKFYRVMQ